MPKYNIEKNVYKISPNFRDNSYNFAEIEYDNQGLPRRKRGILGRAIRAGGLMAAGAAAAGGVAYAGNKNFRTNVNNVAKKRFSQGKDQFNRLMGRNSSNNNNSPQNSSNTAPQKAPNNPPQNSSNTAPQKAPNNPPQNSATGNQSSTDTLPKSKKIVSSPLTKTDNRKSFGGQELTSTENSEVYRRRRQQASRKAPSITNARIDGPLSSKERRQVGNIRQALPLGQITRQRELGRNKGMRALGDSSPFSGAKRSGGSNSRGGQLKSKFASMTPEQRAAKIQKLNEMRSQRRATQNASMADGGANVGKRRRGKNRYDKMTGVAQYSESNRKGYSLVKPGGFNFSEGNMRRYNRRRRF